MERLLKDAEEFSGVKYDISNLADVYNAIHVIQEQMGITGTTAKEAADTITGSFGSLSAAWQNLVAGFADKDANLSALIDNVVKAAEGSFGHIIPIAEQAVIGIGNFVEEIAPVIAEKLPNVVNEILPGILTTADQVVNTLVTALPGMLQSVVDVVPQVITDVTTTAINMLPSLVEMTKNGVITLAKGITDSAPALITAAADAVSEIADTLTNPDTLQDIFNAGLELIVALGTGIGDNIPKLVKSAVDIAINFVDFLTDAENIKKYIGAAIDIVIALGDGLIKGAPEILKAAVFIPAKIIDAIFTTDWIKVGQDLLARVIEGIRSQSEDIDATPVTKGIKNLSEGYFSYYDDVLGEADNKLREFTEKYADVIEDYGDGFKFKFDGTEDAQYVVKVLEDLQTAIVDTGEASGELQNAYAGVHIALNDLSADVNEALKAERELNMQSSKFIPTEAIRQQAGQAAEPIRELGAELGAVNEKLQNLGENTANAVVDATGNAAKYGIVKTIGEALDDAQKEADALAKEVYNAAKDDADRQTTRLKLSYDEQIKLWNGIKDQFVEGSEQYEKALDEIYKIQDKKQTEANKALENAQKEAEKQAAELDKQAKKREQERTKAEKESLKERTNAYNDYAKTIEKISDNIKDIENDYADTLKKRSEDIYNSFGLFEKVPERILYSGTDLTNNLQEQIDRMEKFYGDIATLSQRGVSDALVQEIQSMGVGAIDQLDALLDMSDDELAKYSDLFTRKHDLADSVAEGQLEGAKAQMEQDIQSELDKLAATGKEAGESWGLDFSAGIVEGIKAGFINLDMGANLLLGRAKTWLMSGLETSPLSDGTYETTSAAQRNQSSTANSDNATASSTASTTTGNITVNINGVQFQNMAELALAISQELQFQIDRRAAGYAGA